MWRHCGCLRLSWPGAFTIFGNLQHGSTFAIIRAHSSHHCFPSVSRAWRSRTQLGVSRYFNLVFRVHGHIDRLNTPGHTYHMMLKRYRVNGRSSVETVNPHTCILGSKRIMRRAELTPEPSQEGPRGAKEGPDFSGHS